MTLANEPVVEPGSFSASADERLALALIAEQRHREAERLIARAVETLERHGDPARLAGALTVQGVVHARLGDFESSLATLTRAASSAEAAGAHAQAALALVTLIEEHGAACHLHGSEVYEIYRRADGLLHDTPDAESLERLRACARVVMRRLAGPEVGSEGFYMYQVVHDFEARLIEQALEEGGGSVTKAARLLGLTHQTLGTILNTRHKSLAGKRTPVRKRLRSIIKKPAGKAQH